MLNSEIDEVGKSSIKLVSGAKLPSDYGNFYILGFEGFEDGKSHTAIVKGDIVGKINVLTRVHSECLTGEVFGSQRCDCKDQLQQSLRKIEEEGEGIIIYLRQEGRGIGLLNKVKAYELQDGGLNTLEANRALGFPDDLRSYSAAVAILNALNITSIRLLTNNPDKILALQEAGILIKERLELITPVNKNNADYLATKKHHLNHLLDRGMNAEDYI